MNYSMPGLFWCLVFFFFPFLHFLYISVCLCGVHSRLLGSRHEDLMLYLFVRSFSAARWWTTARRPKWRRSWACRSSPSPTTKPNDPSRWGRRLWPTYWSVRSRFFDSFAEAWKGKERKIFIDLLRPLLNLFFFFSRASLSRMHSLRWQHEVPLLISLFPLC